jgi:NifB/MoaA-like Fe-S oxidoreductase
MFGATVTTAGLLPGAAIADAVAARSRFDDVLLPGESLNDDGVFVDDISFDDVARRLAPAVLHPAFELTSALAAL